MQQSQRGNRTAFGRLIDRHYRGLYRFAYQCLGHPGDADDICQETFLLALGRIRSLRNGDSFRPAIYKIVLNLVRRRRQRHRAEAAGILGCSEATVSRQLEMAGGILSYLCVVEETGPILLFCQLPAVAPDDPRQMTVLRNLVHFACQAADRADASRRTRMERGTP